jgi:hypothetical protein
LSIKISWIIFVDTVQYGKCIAANMGDTSWGCNGSNLFKSLHERPENYLRG